MCMLCVVSPAVDAMASASVLAGYIFWLRKSLSATWRKSK
jgi:hypothetical protein